MSHLQGRARIAPVMRSAERGNAMDWEQRCMKLCAWVLTLALFLRLWAGGALTPVGQAMQTSDAASFLLYLHTGRVVRLASPEPVAVLPPAPPEETAPAFQAADLALVEISNEPGLPADPEALLTAPLDLLLADGQPRVLILHSHTTESPDRGPIRGNQPLPDSGPGPQHDRPGEHRGGDPDRGRDRGDP